jgi:hypothetical protein
LLLHEKQFAGSSVGSDFFQASAFFVNTKVRVQRHMVPSKSRESIAGVNWSQCKQQQ